MNDFREATNDGMLSDMAELMNRREARNDGVIPDGHVPSKAAIVRKDDVIAELAIMRNVAIAEKQIVRADASGQLFVGAAMYGAVLAEDIVISDLEGGWLTNVFKILGFPSNQREGEKLITFPESRGAFEHDVGVENTIVAKGDVCADDAVGADADVLSEFGFRRNDGGGMDH